MRFLFGAVISIAAALLSQRFGHRFGGLFLAFPAILPASLTLIEKRSGTHPAMVDAMGATLGAVALGVFALSAIALLPRAPLAVALLGAAAAWLLVAGALYFAAARLLALGGRHPAAPDRAGSVTTARRAE